jgi:hypothetical protein
MPVSLTSEPVTALVVTVTAPEEGTTMLYQTSLLTGVPAKKHPVADEFGGGTPMEAVAPRLVVIVGVHVAAGVRTAAVAQSSLDAGGEAVVKEMVVTGAVAPPVQLPIIATV